MQPLIPEWPSPDGRIPKWDLRALQMAHLVSSFSKDPSTKSGAVILRPDKTVASVGYNGFPRKLRDDDELYANREVKYARVIHCEMNAALHAKQDLEGCTLYTFPWITCDRCAVHMIEWGIARLVTITPDPEREARWKTALDAARAFWAEAGIPVSEYPRELYVAPTLTLE